MNVLLDTHVWLGWLLSESPLPARERIALDAHASRRELSISAITLWETQMLYAKGRVRLPLPLAAWLQEALPTTHLLPLDADVIVALDGLPESFHGDPADRIIVATARAHSLPLSTHDRKIRTSRLVRLWKP